MPVPLSVASSHSDDSATIHLVNDCITRAIQEQASDIHLEPYEHFYRIRFRRDGILEEIKRLSVDLGSRIAARIKIMAHLDIGERRLPQDGRIKFSFSSKQTIDLRVSICPTMNGEKIMIRVLRAALPEISIEYLGLEPKQKDILLQAITRPQGLILVTGPTGSGKTVTLYSALSLLNNQERNISSIEDPIEIVLPGVNQVAVNPKIGLTFAHALRAFLRQDPDVIMVGEIRDLETATMAFRASLTGHLVLSTLHTNSACEAMIRLLQMGVEPYLIASSLTLVIAQRLVRILCPQCKESTSNHESPYRAKGCELCSRGYKGRTGIFEVLPVSEVLAHSLFGEKASVASLTLQAQKEGLLFLRDAGMNKVKEGITTLDELKRVL